jgi:hypothetical protein
MATPDAACAADGGRGGSRNPAENLANASTAPLVMTRIPDDITPPLMIPLPSVAEQRDAKDPKPDSRFEIRDSGFGIRDQG